MRPFWAPRGCHVSLRLVAMTAVATMLEAESYQRKVQEARTKIHTQYEDTRQEESILPWQQPKQGKGPMPSNGPSYAPEVPQQQQQSQPDQTQYRRPERQNLHLERAQPVEEPRATTSQEVIQPVVTPEVDPSSSIRERFRRGINIRPGE